MPPCPKPPESLPVLPRHQTTASPPWRRLPEASVDPRLPAPSSVAAKPDPPDLQKTDGGHLLAAAPASEPCRHRSVPNPEALRGNDADAAGPVDMEDDPLLSAMPMSLEGVDPGLLVPLIRKDAATIPHTDVPDLVPLREVPAGFRRSGRTISRWVRRGLLTPTRHGGSAFVAAADLRQLMAAQMATEILGRQAKTPRTQGLDLPRNLTK